MARDLSVQVEDERGIIKLKNFSKDQIPPEIEAICSLGPKACPVELDINSARLDGEIHSFLRRLRLTEHFNDKEDFRSDEEKRFYTKKTDFIPEPGKSAPGNMEQLETLKKNQGQLN
jgi:hypothetical protein